MNDSEVECLLKGYDTLIKVKLKFIMEEVRRAVKQGSAEKPLILDCGCGIGHVSALLASQGYEVIGIDIHPPSIEEAKASHPNIVFLCHDATTYDCPHRFDAIVISEVLEHLEQPGKLLANMRRLLKPAGVLIVTVPNGFSAPELFYRFYGALLLRTFFHKGLRWLRRKLVDDNKFYPSRSRAFEMMAVQYPHIQSFTSRRLRKLFQSEHLGIVKWRNRGFLCNVPIMRVCSFKLPQVFRLDFRVAERLPRLFGFDWLIVLKRIEPI